MVLYFSATGNTEFIAKELAKRLDDESINLLERIKTQDYTVKQNVENLILSIFPPLLLGVPRNLFQLFSSEKFSFLKSLA